MDTACIPRISVIIPSCSNSEDSCALSILKKVDYPEDKIEVFLSIGNWPPAQRNEAAKLSKGDILYFCNKDSCIESDVFKKLVTIFKKDRKAAGVGGPDLTPSNNNHIQHLFGYAMGSYFAHWKMRARYSQVGKERLSDERELLLSNLAVRRDIYLEVGGFNDNLYPNEENELINRISKMGYHFIYSPEVKIYRDRRKTIAGFIKQFHRYGRGRMRQVLIEGVHGDLHFFLPIFLLGYFLFLPFIRGNWLVLIPLFIYVAFALIDAAYISFKNKKPLVLELPLIYIIMHISYGTGMLMGLFKISSPKKRRREAGDCKVIEIQKT